MHLPRQAGRAETVDSDQDNYKEKKRDDKKTKSDKRSHDKKPKEYQKGGKTPLVPKALGTHCRAQKKNGDPICFGFNLKTCNTTCKTGERCPRGFRTCCYEGRTENHAKADHH